jgi:kelch-like protein 20
MESEEFMLLPINQLVDIISSDELNVRTEEQVYMAVMGWVKYNIQERREHLPSVSKSKALVLSIIIQSCIYKRVCFFKF